MAKLVIAGDEAHTAFELSDVVTIGRQSTNGIPIQGEKISRQHARVIPTGDKYIVEDLGSANGTFVNGTKITRGALSHGDTLRIGDTNLIFHDDIGDQLEGDLLGNYRIRRKIGQGGMGAVYSAIQITMDRTVAMKLLKPELTRSPAYLKSFISEARTAGQLNHPNIVQVHDFGEVNGIYFFSMEFVEGETVHDVLARESKIPVDRSLDIVMEVAKALEHAQRHRIIHQDIKPQNIMIDKVGKVKLADLGLAKVVGRRDARQPRGTIMGTPHYMAPEQAKGEKVDGRADIYALGATWYHMITGRVPFDGNNSLAVITKHINQQAPSAKQYDVTIPDDVCGLIEKMMAKDPADRPGDAKALQEELEKLRSRIGGTLAATARKKETAKRVKRKAKTSAAARGLRAAPEPAKSSSMVLPAALATVALLLVVVVYLLFFAHSETARPVPGPEGGGGAPGGRPGLAELVKRAEAARATNDASRELSTLRELAVLYPDAAETREALERMPRLEEELKKAEEVRAEREFRSIMGLPRSTGDERVAVIRLLKHFVSVHGEVPEWASKARIEIAKLDMSASSGAAGSPSGSESGSSGSGDLRDEVNTVKLRASKLERLNQFAAAKRTLREFVEANRGTPEAQDAARSLSALERRADAHYKSIFDRAKEFSRRRSYVRATALFTRLLAEDPTSHYAELARKELRENDEATERLYKATMARAGAKFRILDFEGALRELDRSRPALAGTRWGSEVASAVERMSLAPQCFKDLAVKVGASPGRTLDFKMNDLAGKPRKGKIVTANAEGIGVNLSGAVVPKKWTELTDKQVYEVHLLYRPKGDEHVRLGAYFLCRGMEEFAKTELETAVRQGASVELAKRLLASMGPARKEIAKYDFSRWEQAGDWEASGGNWSILGGELAQEGRNEAEIRLNKEMPAKDLKFSLEFTVRNDGGLFAVEFVQDKESFLGIAVDSRGYEANASVRGAGKSERGDWKYSSGKKHKLTASLARDILTVTIDGKKMPELSAGGMEGLTGKLVIKSLDTSCAVDNIVLGNAR